ncbi:MAG: hypothetical protein IAG13_26010 [Deltaproteobacteria bacterium]|nr:hypothetical protein [Nannocystaceae bacterium]
MRCAAELVIAALLVAGCDAGDADAADSDDGSSSDEGSTTGDAPMWTSLDERPCPPDSWLTWESFGGPFVLDYCTSCHGSGLPDGMRQMAPVGLDFDDVEDVRAHAGRIWARAADHNMTMPPAGAAPQDERTWLGEWLACGAPTEADRAE